jgi:hypothetical protein
MDTVIQVIRFLGVWFGLSLSFLVGWIALSFACGKWYESRHGR